MIKFMGRGAGFSDEHNGACFGLDKKLILLDCPLVTFNKLKKTGLDAAYNACVDEAGDEVVTSNADGFKDGGVNFGASNGVKELIIVVTHTHSDHIGGLSLTIHFATFIWKIHVTVIAPFEAVKADLKYMFDNLDGCDTDTYDLVTAEEYIAGFCKNSGEASGNGLDKTSDNTSDNTCWLKAAIPTKHVPALAGKCFGYALYIEGKNVIYTGDTCTLDPYLPYIDIDKKDINIEEVEETDNSETILYTECSAYDTGVHMFVDKLLEMESYFKENKVKVYLMHLDNVEEISKKIKDSCFELAPYCDILL